MSFSRYFTYLFSFLIGSSFFLFASCANTPKEKIPSLNVLVHDAFLSSESEEFDNAIKVFEEKEKIKINWISYGNVSPALLKKVQNPNFPIDLLYGVDNTTLGDFKDTNSFISYQPEGIDYIQENLLLDKDFFFVPINYGWIALEYSTDNLKKNPPEKIEDLLKEEWKGSYLISNPRTSDLGLLLALWLESQGKKVSELLPALMQNSFLITPDWSSSWLLYMAKEAPLIFTYGTSPTYNIFIEKNENYKTTLDEESSYLQIEFMGISSYTKEEEKAKKFLDYMISEEVQKTIPRKVWVMPSRKEIDLPTEFKSLHIPHKLFSHTPEEIKKLKEEWLNSSWF